MQGILGWVFVIITMSLLASLMLRDRDPNGPLPIVLIGLAVGLLADLPGVAMKVGKGGQPDVIAGSDTDLFFRAFAARRESGARR